MYGVVVDLSSSGIYEGKQVSDIAKERKEYEVKVSCMRDKRDAEEYGKVLQSQSRTRTLKSDSPKNWSCSWWLCGGK